MTTATRRPAVRRTIATAAALTVLGLAGACGGGADESADGDDGGGGDMATSAEVPAEAADGVARDVALADAPAEEEQKLISHGAVQLKSDDVAEAIFEVRNVLDTYAGEVEANETQTDDEGEPLRARLTLRVPTDRFDEAMQDLEGVAVLISSSGDTKDVTTEVLDRDIRVDVQRRSIERISLLLEEATSIRDVVAIEAQLSQRQADLAVLEKEQRYLADQTEMATITVSVERIKEKRKPAAEKSDDSGFFAGLATGWGGLKTFGVGLATVLGALLPWMVVAAVVAIPTVPLLRRHRRRGGASTSVAQA